MNVDRITLEKIQFGIQTMVSKAFIDDLRYDTINDYETQSIIKQLRGYILGNKVHHEEVDSLVHRYPATIWEELKRDFWPKWLKRKFPVRYSTDITHTVHNHYHVCPHLNIKDDRKHLDFMVYNDVDVRSSRDAPIL